ncbi:MAG: HYR domain-containing protein [Lewinellaceae bacterium]|nr:HYR domain-containing protein [Lewinellaceae bacterium]
MSSLSISQTNFTCPNLGQNTVILTVTDDAGNTNTCEATVTIEDNIDPILDCPAPVTLSADADCEAQIPDFAGALSTNNCNNATITQVPAAGTTITVGTTTVTVTATDNSGNSASCTTTVTVEDAIPPTLTCPADLTADCLADEHPVYTTWDAFITDGGAGSDNCSLNTASIILESESNNGTICSRIVTRTYRIADAFGNTATCSHTLTIDDDSAPTWTTNNLPQDVTVQCGEEVNPTPTLTATDNCLDNVLIEFNETLLPGAGPNDSATLTRIWTAYDICGNSIRHTQVVTILDTEDPELHNLPDITVEVECADDVPTMPDPPVYATDNCEGTVDFDFTEILVPGDCPNRFMIIRTWTATDFAGNSTVFSQKITVTDTEAPELAVRPLRRHYDCREAVEDAPYQFATDNCGVAFVDFYETENPGNCPNNVIIVRRWVAYDLCGNTSEWEQEIHVLDTIAPVLRSTPVDRIYACAEDIPVAPSVQAEDNCDIVFVDFAETTEPGSCPNQYTITRRWYAYDLCGNTDEHWQTITVKDSIAPTWTSALPDDVTVQCGEDANPAAVMTASDNCATPVDIELSEAFLPGAGPNDGATLTRTWTATDVCGNAIVHTQVVTILDTQAPALQNLPQANVGVVCSKMYRRLLP